MTQLKVIIKALLCQLLMSIKSELNKIMMSKEAKKNYVEEMKKTLLKIGQ